MIGKGKLQDILLRSMHLGADVLVFDGELAPSQLRNIATETELKVLDRTQLILDLKNKACKPGETFVIINQKGIDPLALDMLARFLGGGDGNTGGGNQCIGGQVDGGP